VNDTLKIDGKNNDPGNLRWVPRDEAVLNEMLVTERRKGNKIFHKIWDKITNALKKKGNK